MNLKVCPAGATGWIGRPLADAIAIADDLELAATVARRARGESVAGVTVSGSVSEALSTPFDVFVDYTSAEAVKANVLEAVAARRHVVIGSSGLTEDDFAEIDRVARAQSVGVIAVGNFAVSALFFSASQPRRRVTLRRGRSWTTRTIRKSTRPAVRRASSRGG